MPLGLKPDRRRLVTVIYIVHYIIPSWSFQVTPLATFIMPPLRQCSRSCVVVGLFENDETVSPELELLNLDGFVVKSSTFDQSLVQDTAATLFVILTQLSEPLLFVLLATP